MLFTVEVFKELYRHITLKTNFSQTLDIKAIKIATQVVFELLVRRFEQLQANTAGVCSVAEQQIRTYMETVHDPH